MSKYKTKNTVTELSEGERRFNKIMRYHTDDIELTKHELEIAGQFFMLGWHQSLLSTIDLLENKGEKYNFEKFMEKRKLQDI